MDQLRIHEIFSNVAAQYAAHVALDQGSRPPITYRALEDESNRLANFLISSGAEPGSIVAIMARESARMVTAFLAILKARCVFAPFDPRIPDNRLRLMAEQITPGWFIIDSERLAKVAEIVSESKGRVKVICLDDEPDDYASEAVTASSQRPDQ